MNLDYYKILGIEKNASDGEIKSAFKKLAVKYHPDKNEGELLSEEIFKKVKEAYEILSDQNRRKQYDQIMAYQEKTTTAKSTTHRTQQKRTTIKKDSISDRKATFIAFAFVSVIIIGVLIAYPYINKWASNDKMKSAYKSAKSENWSEAFVYSSAAIEQWDENGSAYLLRAQINVSIFGHYQKGISDFNQAIQLLPPDSIRGEHYYMRAKAFHELGNSERACRDLHSSYKKGFERAYEDIQQVCK